MARWSMIIRQGRDSIRGSIARRSSRRRSGFGRWSRIRRPDGRRSIGGRKAASRIAGRIAHAVRRHPKAAGALLWTGLLVAAILLIPGVLVRPGGESEPAGWAEPGSLDSAEGTGAPGRTAGGAGTDAGRSALSAYERGLLGDLEETTWQGRPLSFPIYSTKQNKIIRVTLEQYVRGVVAAEMPIEFDPEALKAQAIAARTYIVKRLADQDVSNVPVQGAWVTDSEQHQVYLDEASLLAKWSGKEREANLRKLTEAVRETRGQIIVYEGAPILAAFFSTSSGYTEHSEQYWSERLPYLRSVASPWERAISPKFESKVTFTPKEFARKLGLSEKSVSVSSARPGTRAGSTSSSATVLPIRVLERSAGKRIAKISIGGKEFTGREVREKLGLASTQFTWRMDGGRIELTVYGNGHGVGMSQWGAQGMALAGYKAEDILQHYYSGVSIEKIQDLQTILQAPRSG